MTYQFFSARLRGASSSEIRPRLALARRRLGCGWRQQPSWALRSMRRAPRSLAVDT